MASPSPSSPPALQPGTARQRSTSGCTHLRDHDAFPSLKATDSSRRAGAPTQHRDELLAAIVKTPKPGQLLIAVRLHLPYDIVSSVVLVDLSALSSAAAAAVQAGDIADKLVALLETGAWAAVPFVTMSQLMRKLNVHHTHSAGCEQSVRDWMETHGWERCRRRLDNGQQAWGYARSTPVQQQPAAHVSKARTIWIWLLTALLVALWLGGIAALADEPSELDVMRATAAAARDVEREGAFVDGVSPWDSPSAELVDTPIEAHRVARYERATP